jgi:hypothetical protein
VNRIAIGYAPDQENRAVVVFIETDTGVVLQARDAPAPRLIDSPVLSDVEPGAPEFFNTILDSFSTTYLIRTVREFEPDVLSSMLATDQVWDLLPRSAVTA